MHMREALALWRRGTLAIKPTPTRCNKCHRDMPGTTAHDGACACGGLIEAKPEEKLVQVETKVETPLDPDKPSVNGAGIQYVLSNDKFYKGQYNAGTVPNDKPCPQPVDGEKCDVCGWLYGCRDCNSRKAAPATTATVAQLPVRSTEALELVL